MKVTRLIREYVEKNVSDAYPLNNLKEYDEVIIRVKEAREVYNHKVNEFCKLLISDLKKEYEIPEDWIFKFVDRCTLEESGYDAEVSIKNRKHFDCVKEKRRSAIDEILLRLELGANRDELTRMISELCKDSDNN